MAPCYSPTGAPGTALCPKLPMSCPCPHHRNPALLLQLLRTGSSFSFGPLVPRQAKQHRVASSSSRAPSQSSFGERLSMWVGAKPAAGLPAAATSLCLALGPELCSSVSLPWDISCPAAFGEGMPRATLVLRISLQHSQPMGAAGGDAADSPPPPQPRGRGCVPTRTSGPLGLPRPRFCSLRGQLMGVSSPDRALPCSIVSCGQRAQVWCKAKQPGLCRACLAHRAVPRDAPAEGDAGCSTSQALPEWVVDFNVVRN